MQVTTEYLDAFAVEPVEPTEVPINGWEMFAGAGSVTLDDPDGRTLLVMHWDEWPSERQWRINRGTDKRWTHVTIMKGNEPVGPVAYEFPGLIKLDGLRTWFRAKLDIVDPEPDADAA